MKSTIEKKENNKVTFKIEIDAEKFEEGIQKAYIRNRSKFNIPGFRKGKAPRKIIEINYGKGVFYEDAINILLPDAYDSAIEELKLEPVDRPEIDIEQIEPGKPLIIIAEVTVKPEVELGEYKGVEVEKAEYNVTDDDVLNELKIMQDKNARIIEAEDRPIKEGDILTIDYKGYIDEEQFEGGTAENQTLKVGSGTFIPGFEEQLIGKTKGEEVEINVKFPEDYHAENLAGKEAVFKVNIHEIKEKELPELDDEFAKDVSEVDTLDELKKDIKNKLEKTAKDNEKRENENRVIEKIVEASKVDIPEVMIDKQIDSEIQEFGYRLRYQGIELNQYLELTNTKMEDLREQFKEGAEKAVKTELVLDSISEKENIKETKEELDKEVEELAKQYGQDVGKFKEKLKETDLEYIKMGIIRKKTIDFLVKNAILS